MIEKVDFTKDEQLIYEAILEGRKVQEYLWQEVSLLNYPFSADNWQNVFQKRVNKIFAIDINSPSSKVELRKRILQQAALSILALRILDEKCTK